MYWMNGAVRYLATAYDEVYVVCKNKYASFKNAMNGVISPNSMRNKFLAYNPDCSEPLPTVGGRKSRKNRKNKRKTRRRKN
jgi:hypothetical protein